MTVDEVRGSVWGIAYPVTFYRSRAARWPMAMPHMSKDQWHGDTSDTQVSEFEAWLNAHAQPVRLAVHPSRRKGNDAEPVQTLRQRLDNANNHFRKKAAAVFGDGDAVRLLARLYQAVIVDIADFDACKDGVSLAKLTAANFCEIGAKSIYITEAGQNFIDAINSDE